MADEPVVTEPVVEGQEGAAEGAEKKEHQVPVSVLTAEREKFHGREDQLRATIDTLNGELRTIKAQIEKKVAGVARDEKDEQREQWAKYLGMDKLEERLAKAEARAAKLDELEQRLPEIEYGSKIAQEAYYGQVSQFVRSHHDPKLMNCSALGFEKMVIGEMTPEETWAIKNGDQATLMKVIERTKKDFTPSQLAARTREAQHVRSLPKTPGAGGIAPGSEPKAKPFTSLRDLHKQAGEDFAAIREREKG